MIDCSLSDLPNQDDHDHVLSRYHDDASHNESSSWSTRSSLADDKPLLPLPSTTCLHAPSSRPRPRLFRSFRPLLSVILAFLGALVLWRTLHEFRSCNNGAVSGMQVGANQQMGDRLGYKVVQSLPDEVVPKMGQVDAEEKRLVFVGDVHGMYDELVDLLNTVNFNEQRDHLVLTGDLVMKGPESLKVIDLAREYGASCVRGNQDDRVLLYYHDFERQQAINDAQGSSFDKRHASSGRAREARELATQMTKEQAEWLDQCPLILTAKDVPALGDIAVVHAGLVPGVELEQQNPNSVMNMRSIDPELRVASHRDRGGMHWATLWNKVEEKKQQPLTVIYGHYAAAGLDIRPFSKGLDSDCSRGGKLSALIVSNLKPKEEIVSVDCRKMSP